MTHERGEEVVLIAIILSIALHVGLMFWARPRVMAALPPNLRSMRTAQMRMGDAKEPPPEAVRLADIPDLKAVKEAPRAIDEIARTPDLSEAARARAALPIVPVQDPTPVRPSDTAPTRFDDLPIRIEEASFGSLIPTLPIAVPNLNAASAGALALPATGPASAQPSILPAAAEGAFADADIPAAPTLAPAKIVRTRPAALTIFKPSPVVTEEVNEKAVLETREAVRSLVDSDSAKPLEKVVNVTLAKSTVGGWTYFRAMIVPRTSLPTIPKDVVVILDASGSIGNDRLTSCRRAARRILRSAVNTGDRFNLVAFRDRFSYAFRSWQECTRASFEKGDRWLANLVAHGRTDVFATISSVLTLPRDPMRPMIALVVTDGDANEGVSDNAAILSKFTALNDGLVSIYMYGVKQSANRELIDVLTHGNRGESFIFEGFRWSAGDGLESLSQRFRDPVMSDLRVIFASTARAETYPRRLKNLYRSETLTICGRVPAGVREVAFSLRGLAGKVAHEGYFTLPFNRAKDDPTVVADWNRERTIDGKLK